LADRRIFPAFDILKSSTRKDELLLKPETLAQVMAIIRMFEALGDKENITEVMMEQMKKSKTNEEFLKKVGKK
jgi:transcription termination factor Rho